MNIALNKIVHPSFHSAQAKSSIEQSYLDWGNLPTVVERGDFVQITTPYYEDEDIERHTRNLDERSAEIYKKIINTTEHKKLIYDFEILELIKNKPPEELEIIEKLVTSKDKWGELMCDTNELGFIAAADPKRLKKVSEIALNQNEQGLWNYVGEDIIQLLTMSDTKLWNVEKLTRIRMNSQDILRTINDDRIDINKLVDLIDGHKNKIKEKPVSVSFEPSIKKKGNYNLELYADNGERVSEILNSELKTLAYKYFESHDCRVNYNPDKRPLLNQLTLANAKNTTINLDARLEENEFIKKLLTADLKSESLINKIKSKVFKNSPQKTVKKEPLTSDEVDALRKYAYGRGVVRNSKDYSLEDSKLPEVLKHINNALKKTTLKEDTVLFRGIKGSEIKNFGIGIDSMSDIQDFVKQKSFISKGLMSTSLSNDIAFKFGSENGVILRFFMPKGTNCVSMMDCLGEFSQSKEVPAIKKRIEKIVKAEKELLLPMGKEYEIKNVYNIPVEIEKWEHIPNVKRTYYVIDCVPKIN